MMLIPIMERWKLKRMDMTQTYPQGNALAEHIHTENGVEEYKFNHMTDDEIVALPEVAPLLDVKRHNTPMTFAQIKTLVKALQPGMARAANLERYGHVWRLRFALRLDGSKRVRRSILIADAETLLWVREYFDWARSKRQEYKSEAAAIRFKKFWEAGGREFAESIAARLEAYDHIA